MTNGSSPQHTPNPSSSNRSHQKGFLSTFLSLLPRTSMASKQMMLPLGLALALGIFLFDTTH
jgi:hypothetical protein